MGAFGRARSLRVETGSLPRSMSGMSAIWANRSRSGSVSIDVTRMLVTRAQLHWQLFFHSKKSARACHTVTPELNSRRAAVWIKFAA